MKERTIAVFDERCRKPRCPRAAKAFGLCASCYGIARQAVLDGLTTWEELRQKGRAAEPRRTTKEWLLGK